MIEILQKTIRGCEKELFQILYSNQFLKKKSFFFSKLSVGKKVQFNHFQRFKKFT